MELSQSLVKSLLPNFEGYAKAKGRTEDVMLYRSQPDYAAFYTADNLMVRCFGWNGQRFEKVVVSRWFKTGFKKSDGDYRVIETPKAFNGLVGA